MVDEEDTQHNIPVQHDVHDMDIHSNRSSGKKENANKKPDFRKMSTLKEEKATVRSKFINVKHLRESGDRQNEGSVSNDSLLKLNAFSPPQKRRRSSSVYKLNSTDQVRIEGSNLLKLDKEVTVDCISDKPSHSPSPSKEFTTPSPPRINISKRKIQRPDFLEQTFDAPEIINYYMLEDCKCRERRNQEIKIQFEDKVDQIMDFLKGVKVFYESTALYQETAGEQLSTVGNPSKSFLSAVQSSPLFE